MPTHIYDKKRFLEFIEKGISDDEVIIFTNEINQIEYKKKIGVKQANMLFSCDAFKLKDTVGDLAKNPTVGFCILKRKDVSESALKFLEP